MKYYLSLGSNLGDRENNLDRALSLLREEGVEIVRKLSCGKLLFRSFLNRATLSCESDNTVKLISLAVITIREKRLKLDFWETIFSKFELIN